MNYKFRGYKYTHPANPTKNDIFFNKTCQKLYMYNGSKWIEVHEDEVLGNTDADITQDPNKAYKRAMDII